MLNKDFLLPTFLRYLKLANKWGCFGFSWESTKKRIILLESRREVYYHKFCVIAYILLVAINCVQTLMVQAPEQPIAEKYAGVYLAIWYFGFVQPSISYHLKQDEVRKLFNEVIDISKKHEGRWKMGSFVPALKSVAHAVIFTNQNQRAQIAPPNNKPDPVKRMLDRSDDKSPAVPSTTTTTEPNHPRGAGDGSMSSLDRTEKLITILLKYGFGLYTHTPKLAAAIFVGIVPCQSANPGKMLLPQCNPSLQELHWIGKLLANVLVYLINYFILAFSEYICIIMATSVLVLTMLIRFHLKEYASFYFRENKSEGGDERFETVRLFRQMQVLCEEFNGFHAVHVTGPFIMLIITLQINGITAVIKMALVHTPAPILALFALYVVLLISGHFSLLQSMAEISIKSGSLLAKLKARKAKHGKYYEKFRLSCKPMRVYFGSSNFVERLTPLVSQNFAFDQIVNLLLLD